MAAGGGIDGGPEAGGAAADDRDVEGAGVGGELREEVFAVHGSILRGRGVEGKRRVRRGCWAGEGEGGNDE